MQLIKPPSAQSGSPNAVSSNGSQSTAGLEPSRSAEGNNTGGAEGDEIDATGVALRCEMCAAKFGLWEFVPKKLPGSSPSRSRNLSGKQSLK